MRTARDIEHALGRYGDAVWRACLLYLPPPLTPKTSFRTPFSNTPSTTRLFTTATTPKPGCCALPSTRAKTSTRRPGSATPRLRSSWRRGGRAPSGVADDEAAYRLAEVTDALNALGDPPKTQLYLALYEGYSAREIAEMTGMPEGTVYSWISRGKKKLREVLT